MQSLLLADQQDEPLKTVEISGVASQELEILRAVEREQGLAQALEVQLLCYCHPSLFATTVEYGVLASILGPDGAETMRLVSFGGLRQLWRCAL